QAEDGIRDRNVTGVQTCALPISNDLKKMKSLHGLTRTLIYNMIVGVTKGYEKVLEINGVGYRGAKQGKKLVLNLGYSHPVEMIRSEERRVGKGCRYERWPKRDKQ